jgi:hypothetical protein
MPRQQKYRHRRLFALWRKNATKSLCGAQVQLPVRREAGAASENPRIKAGDAHKPPFSPPFPSSMLNVPQHRIDLSYQRGWQQAQTHHLNRNASPPCRFAKRSSSGIAMRGGARSFAYAVVARESRRQREAADRQRHREAGVGEGGMFHSRHTYSSSHVGSFCTTVHLAIADMPRLK